MGAGVLGLWFDAADVAMWPPATKAKKLGWIGLRFIR